MPTAGQNLLITLERIQTDIFTSANYFIGKEDYEEVQTCLGTVFSEIDDLQNNGIEVDGVHYSVIW